MERTLNAALLAALTDEWQTVSAITKQIKEWQRNTVRVALVRLLNEGDIDGNRRDGNNGNGFLWVFRKKDKGER